AKAFEGETVQQEEYSDNPTCGSEYAINTATGIFIPVGRLASNDESLKRKRADLRRSLLAGERISISPTGSVTDVTGTNTGMVIPPGKLANNDEALRRRREELKKRLLEGGKISISPTGGVM